MKEVVTVVTTVYHSSLPVANKQGVLLEMFSKEYPLKIDLFRQYCTQTVVLAN